MSSCNSNTKPSLNVFSTGFVSISTKPSQPPSQETFSLVFWILLVSKSLTSTPSNNFASTTLTKNSNSFSITTCSFSNRKPTRRKVLTGQQLTSVWTWPQLSILSKNQWVSLPFSKKNVCSQRHLIPPSRISCMPITWARLMLSLNLVQNQRVNVIPTLNFTTMLVLLVTTSMTGLKRTMIQLMLLLLLF